MKILAAIEEKDLRKLKPVFRAHFIGAQNRLSGRLRAGPNALLRGGNLLLNTGPGGFYESVFDGARQDQRLDECELGHCVILMMLLTAADVV